MFAAVGVFCIYWLLEVLEKTIVVFGIVILLKTKFFESPKYNGSCQEPIDYESRHIK